jgi:hypothetical protein
MTKENEIYNAAGLGAPTEAATAATVETGGRRRARTQQQEPPESDIISTDVLCERLDKSRGTIENWRRAGWLPFIQIGRSVMFSWSSVLEALRRQERRAE